MELDSSPWSLNIQCKHESFSAIMSLYTRPILQGAQLLVVWRKWILRKSSCLVFVGILVCFSIPAYILQLTTFLNSAFLLKQILSGFPNIHSLCLSSDLFLPCLTELCPVPCGSHGACSEGQCQCEEGWTGAACDQRACHPRCEEHGQCHDGTCICQPGWEGEHCNIGELCVCTRVRTINSHRYINEYWKKTTCCLSSSLPASNPLQSLMIWTWLLKVFIFSLEFVTMSPTISEMTNERARFSWHTFSDGCPGLCSGHGRCTLEQSGWRCVCQTGWSGPGCSVVMETDCSDGADNDGGDISTMIYHFLSLSLFSSLFHSRLSGRLSITLSFCFSCWEICLIVCHRHPSMLSQSCWVSSGVLIILNTLVCLAHMCASTHFYNSSPNNKF